MKLSAKRFRQSPFHYGQPGREETEMTVLSNKDYPATDSGKFAMYLDYLIAKGKGEPVLYEMPHKSILALHGHKP